MNQILTRHEYETENDYCKRIISLKDSLDMTWAEVADTINNELGYTYSPDRYRKMKFSEPLTSIDGDDLEADYTEIDYEMPTSPEDELKEILFEIKKERVRLSDERSQVNRLTRNIAREENLKEIARDAVEVMSKEKVFTPYIKQEGGDKIGVLCLSDIHYGIEVDSAFNKYNTKIAKERLQKLKDETITKLEAENIKDLCVINMGDLIAGGIHLPIRLNSQIDVITQTMEISEIVAEMLYNFSEHFNIHYASTSDNHSRLEKNKGDSWSIENLARITNWYIKERCKDFVDFIENEFGDDICTFNVGTYKVAAVHGDLPGDKQVKLVQSLSMFTQTHYDLILSAHLHHSSLDVQYGTTRISNGSVMGCDDYAFKLHLYSKPSQNLIVMSGKNPVESLYIINLD